MRNFVHYAHLRGVAVLPEFDSPAHSRAMCAGVPDVPDESQGICMYDCPTSNNYPLRPFDATFDFLKEFRSEILDQDKERGLDAIFPFELFHTGGDEAKTSCYEADNATVAWYTAKGMNASSVWPYFVNRNARMVDEVFDRRPIAWNDAYSDDGNDMIDPSLTLMFWTSWDDGNLFRTAAKNGHKVIAASGNPLYLSLGL